MGDHFVPTVERLRALGSGRTRPILHAASAASLLIATFPGAFKIIAKTFSAQAPAGTAPPATLSVRTARAAYEVGRMN